MRLLQTLVELVELHQRSCISLIKMKGTLHVLESLFLAPLLVEAGQCEIAPYTGEVGV